MSRGEEEKKYRRSDEPPRRNADGLVTPILSARCGDVKVKLCRNEEESRSNDRRQAETIRAAGQNGPRMCDGLYEAFMVIDFLFCR